MKPQLDALAIVTATMDPLRAQDCFASWLGRAAYHYPVYVVWSILRDFPPVRTKQDARAHDDWMKGGSRVCTQAFAPGLTSLFQEGGGVVPAFAKGVEAAFADGAQAVLCLHDDVLIEEDGWDRLVLQVRRGGLTTWTPQFAGFGGSTSLGSDRLYQDPYDPMQLARGPFRSNMRDAEAHGARTDRMERAVVFDGFAQLGHKSWFRDAWKWLADSGIQHHFYDGILGCLAARAHVQGWLLPVQCHHFGGRTAVGSEAYQAWAKTQHPDGDQGFWQEAHRIGYEQFRDVLPVRLRP